MDSPPWADLPSELLELVFLRLPLRTDRAVFLAVCAKWRAAARQCRLPRPSPVPWLMVPDGSATRFPHGQTFQLPDSMRYLRSCGEWLLVSCSDDNDDCFLMNPFTQATMTLPSFFSYSYYQEPVEVPQHYYRVSEDLRTWKDSEGTGDISVLSVVVCSTSLVAAIVAVEYFATIALCRPGAAAWSVSTHPCRKFIEMVFSQGKIYTIDRNGAEDLTAVHIVDEYNSEPRVSQIERLTKGTSSPLQRHDFRELYLLESHGTLLKIRRKGFSISEPGSDNLSSILETSSSEFQVFEADLERHLWVQMRTLGNDQALFLAPGCSRAVRVSPCGVSRDCIFFLDDPMYWFMTGKKTVGSCALYDMKDDKIYSPLPMVSWKSGENAALWIFSQGETDDSANSKGGSSGNRLT